MTSIEDLAPDHFETVAAWLSRPEINKWLTGEWRDREVVATTIAVAVRNKRSRLFLVRHEGAPCGLVALADIDLADRTAMIWYILGEANLSGRGITSEAVRLLAKEAFGSGGVSSLYAWIMEDNVPSRKVLEKAGFREAGRIRGATRSSGRQVDRVYFDLLPAGATRPDGLSSV